MGIYTKIRREQARLVNMMRVLSRIGGKNVTRTSSAWDRRSSSAGTETPRQGLIGGLMIMGRVHQSCRSTGFDALVPAVRSF